MSAEVESAVNPSLEEDDLPGLNGEEASDDDGDLFGDDEDEPQNKYGLCPNVRCTLQLTSIASSGH
jgi:hypothetical protein